MSITTRHSNFELLRIIAMFLILLLHANYLTFGFPTLSEVKANCVSAIGRIYLEHLCIVAVNVYVLISGWFGIRPKLKSFAGLVAQVTFYSTIILLLWLPIIGAKFSLSYLSEIIIVGKPYWFVISYLLLCLISPVLNEFAENASRKTFRIVLLSFFAFEVIYGITYNLGGFDDGYSTLSFVGLYLLAKYLRIYGGRLMQLSRSTCFKGYFIVPAISSLLVVLHLFVIGERSIDKHIDYYNPFVLLSSVLLFIAFQKVRIQNVLINYVSTSAFAVYLIHCNPHVLGYYSSCIYFIYNKVSGIAGLLVIALVLVLIFICCIAIDKIRMMLTPDKLINDMCESINAKLRFLH